jgi:uncharacterized membrane protein
MLRRLGRQDWLAVALLAMVALITALVHERLPERMPIHWNIRGEADGFASRAVGAWLMFPIAAATWALVRFLPLAMPRAQRAKLEASPVSAFALVMTVFFVTMQCLILYAGLNPGFRTGAGVAILLGALWMAIGQMMPRTRRNPIMGIRTAWTLASDENWLRTHHVAGYTMFVGGLITVLAAFLGEHALFVAIPAALVSAFVPVVYSFLLARRLDEK